MKPTRRRVRGVLRAYDYAIVPPQAGEQLDGIRTILAKEHAAARRTGRTWTGRVICERRATHILIVTDSPGQDRGVDRRIENLLQDGNATFRRSAPMVVAATEAPPPSEL